MFQLPAHVKALKNHWSQAAIMMECQSQLLKIFKQKTIAQTMDYIQSNSPQGYFKKDKNSGMHYRTFLMTIHSNRRSKPDPEQLKVLPQQELKDQLQFCQAFKVVVDTPQWSQWCSQIKKAYISVRESNKAQQANVKSINKKSCPDCAAMPQVKQRQMDGKSKSYHPLCAKHQGEIITKLGFIRQLLRSKVIRKYGKDQFHITDLQACKVKYQIQGVLPNWVNQLTSSFESLYNNPRFALALRSQFELFFNSGLITYGQSKKNGYTTPPTVRIVPAYYGSDLGIQFYTSLTPSCWVSKVTYTMVYHQGNWKWESQVSSAVKKTTTKVKPYHESSSELKDIFKTVIGDLVLGGMKEVSIEAGPLDEYLLP